MSDTLKDFQRMVANSAKEKFISLHGVPKPDPIDHDKFPYAVAAGGNKLSLRECATCGKPPSLSGRNDMPKEVFIFRDELSAREYRISGMCQACQDGVFGEGVSGEGEV
jgi:hypothetical protein